MALGHARVVKSNYRQAFVEKQKRVIADYEAAREVGQQSLDANTPVQTGALKASNRAERLTSGIGFYLRSFGNDATGQGYARHVNDGHIVKLKDGTLRPVPPNPYFSQAVADATAELRRRRGR